MLVIEPPLEPIIFSEAFLELHRQKAMQNGDTGDPLVLTLEDDISDEVLKSKSEYYEKYYEQGLYRIIRLLFCRLFAWWVIWLFFS